MSGCFYLRGMPYPGFPAQPLSFRLVFGPFTLERAEIRTDGLTLYEAFPAADGRTYRILFERYPIGIYVFYRAQIHDADRTAPPILLSPQLALVDPGEVNLENNFFISVDNWEETCKRKLS